MLSSQFPVLPCDFSQALALLEESSRPLVAALKKARVARELDDRENDPMLSARPITIGAIAGGQRHLPAAFSWLSTVGPHMAELNGVEVVYWPDQLDPEDMFCAQLFGAKPMSGSSGFGETSFYTAQQMGLFEVAYEAVSDVQTQRVLRPLNAASNVTANFEAIIQTVSLADSIRALLAVFPYTMAALTRSYCGFKVKRHRGVYAGSFAEEYVQELGHEMVEQAHFDSAARFVKMYLPLLATHGANFSELASFWRQTGDSAFNPIGALRAGFDFLGADGHGGAQSLVSKMMTDCRQFMGNDPTAWTFDRLRAWATEQWTGLIYGFGHAKYETGDPRGKRLREFAATDEAITESVNYCFFLFFLEHADRLLSETRPKVRNRIENVDFIAGLLQKVYLGIEEPNALELLFGLARVPAYLKNAYVAKLLGISILRPDDVMLGDLAANLHAENPLRRVLSLAGR